MNLHHSPNLGLAKARFLALLPPPGIDPIDWRHMQVYLTAVDCVWDDLGRQAELATMTVDELVRSFARDAKEGIRQAAKAHVLVWQYYPARMASALA